MDKNKILNQIEANKLENFDYDFIIAQLCVLNNKPFDEMKSALDELILSGEFKIKSKNEPPFPYKSKVDENMLLDAEEMLNRKDKKQKARNKKFKLQGKIQGTKSDFAFLIPFDKTYDDVFIAGKDLKGAINNDTVVCEVGRERNVKQERQKTKSKKQKV